MNWVWVDEGLPPVGDIVMLYFPRAPKKHNQYRTGWLNENRSWGICGGAMAVHESVSHWARFPRLP